jgi:hypothetical protein
VQAGRRLARPEHDAEWSKTSNEDTLGSYHAGMSYELIGNPNYS